MGLGSIVSSGLGLSAGGAVLGTVGGAALSGGLGYLGVRETNESNEAIASARNAMEIEEAAKARDFSAEQAQINREFEERMSNTAVQRRMNDMKEAGINPLLAGKFDATTPAGTVGATAKANAHGYTAQNELGAAVSSASMVLDLMAKKAQIDNIKAQTKFTSNKGDIAGPVAQIADVVSSLMGPHAQSAKSAGPGAIDRALKAIKDNLMKPAAKSGNNLLNNAKKSSDEVKSWWKSIVRDARKFKNAWDTYWNPKK